MRKLLYSTEDIVKEFELAGYMKGLELCQLNAVIPKIREDQYQLYLVMKHMRPVRRIYICEWLENGKREFDDWVLSPDKFCSGIAREYIEEAKKIPY